MIVLIEGPDGSGKTTLCEVFVKKYGFHYIHLGRQEDIEETYKDLLNRLKGTKEDIVIDRAILSNEVYTKIYGGQKLSAKKYAKMLVFINKIILCLPKDKNRYLQEFEKLKGEREELYKDNMERVYNLFSQYKNLPIFDRFKENAEKYVDSFIQSNRK